MHFIDKRTAYKPLQGAFRRYNNFKLFRIQVTL